MVDFGYKNNAIRNQKHFKPIVNGNVAHSSMIALTDESLPCWKSKKEWKFNCKFWIKNSSTAAMLLPKYGRKQLNSLPNASVYLTRYWAN